MFSLIIMLLIGWLLLRWLWPREELRQLCAPRPTVMIVVKHATIIFEIKEPRPES
jgi:hypothetical protein